MTTRRRSSPATPTTRLPAARWISTWRSRPGSAIPSRDASASPGPPTGSRPTSCPWPATRTSRSPRVTASPRATLTRDLSAAVLTVTSGADLSIQSLAFLALRRARAQEHRPRRRCGAGQECGGALRHGGARLWPDLRGGRGTRSRSPGSRRRARWARPSTTARSTVGSPATASLQYRVPDKARAWVRFDRTYRYPFLDEQISYYNYGFDGFLEDLDAEQGYGVAIGAAAGPLAGLEVSADAHLLDMSDEIAFNGATFANENLSATRHLGATAEARWAAGPVEIGASYTGQLTTFRSGDNEGNRVPLVPDHEVVAEAKISAPFGIEIAATGRYVSESYQGGDNANAQDRVPEYRRARLLRVLAAGLCAGPPRALCRRREPPGCRLLAAGLLQRVRTGPSQALRLLPRAGTKLARGRFLQVLGHGKRRPRLGGFSACGRGAARGGHRGAGAGARPAAQAAAARGPIAVEVSLVPPRPAAPPAAPQAAPEPAATAACRAAARGRGEPAARGGAGGVPRRRPPWPRCGSPRPCRRQAAAAARSRAGLPRGGAPARRAGHRPLPGPHRRRGPRGAAAPCSPPAGRPRWTGQRSTP